MKRLSTIFWVLACLASCVVSCDKPEFEINSERVTFIPEQLATKTSVIENGSIASYNWSGTTAAQVTLWENASKGNSVSVVLSNEDKSASFSAEFSGNGPFSYHAVIANSLSEEGNPVLPSVQYPTTTSFDPTADILVGKTTSSVEARPTQVSMCFGRAVAVNKMTLYGFKSESEKIYSVEFSASKTIAGDCSVNYDNCSVLKYGISADEKKVILNYVAADATDDDKANAPSVGSSFSVYFLTFPVATNFSIKVTTDKYVYVKNIASANLELKLSSLNSFTVGLGNAVALPAGSTGGSGDTYTLAPAAGTNNSYTGNCDVTVSGITWNVTGNSQQVPWRLGGKSITKVDRAIYSKNPIDFNVSQVVVSYGSASNITVNSCKLDVYSSANLAAAGAAGDVSSITGTFTSNGNYTYSRPDGSNWSGRYFRFTFNVTVSATNNKYIEFSNAVFSSGTVETPAPNVYSSLEELASAELEENSAVTVSFMNTPIKEVYVNTQSVRNAVVFDIQKDGKDIELYYNDVPEGWTTGGLLSGVVTGAWKKFSGFWEIVPVDSWSWENLTYSAPIQKTITALTVSGTPTKTQYNVGDAFDPSGLVVTATYSDGTSAEISTGFEWTYDYGTGNTAFVAGATTVDVCASIGNDIISDIYTVSGLTVTAPVTLKSIEVSGTPNKTSYYVGDKFETAGLVVTGLYSDGSSATITEGISWDIDPEVLVLTTTSVDVMASVGEVTSEVCTLSGISVIENPLKTATISSFTTTSGEMNSDISYVSYQGNASTAPIVNSSCIRLYQNGGYVRISGIKGVKIQSVTITTGSTYSSTTVGYCVDDNDAPTTGESVAKSATYTISGLNNQSVEIYCLGKDKDSRLDIASLEVKYLKETVTLSSIAISGNYETSFIKNSEFNHDNAVVTATFSDGDKQDVTSSAVFSEPDMTTTGSKDVMVSYTYEGVTETTSYSISVEDEVVESLAISGVYTRVFKTSDTFNHEGVVVKATYNSGRTEDISVSAQYSTPDLTTTGEKVVTVSFGGKSETYTIKVIPSNSIFFESFDKNDGTGGNDNKWSGSIAANNIVCDNTGWTMTSAKGANACAKFGTGSAAGSAKTPSILVSGDIVLTFKAAAWNGNTEVTGLSVSATSGTVDTTSVTMAKAAWTEYSITITGVETSTQITIAASQSSNNRFFLDEVLVTKVETSAASAK